MQTLETQIQPLGTWVPAFGPSRPTPPGSGARGGLRASHCTTHSTWALCEETMSLAAVVTLAALEGTLGEAESLYPLWPHLLLATGVVLLPKSPWVMGPQCPSLPAELGPRRPALAGSWEAGV